MVRVSKPCLIFLSLKNLCTFLQFGLLPWFILLLFILFPISAYAVQYFADKTLGLALNKCSLRAGSYLNSKYLWQEATC